MCLSIFLFNMYSAILLYLCPMSEAKHTDLKTLGEFGLIHHLTKNIELHNASSILGVGDDGAVIESLGKQIVMSTDMLVEDVHFDLSYFPLKHLGYKSVVVNLSDIYAMNADPTQITFSMAISSKYSLEAIEQIYEGALLACNLYGVDLVGGDTTTSTKGLTISITAIGEVRKNGFVKRSGAGNKDLICVSGDLGSAYLGFLLMQREKNIFLQNPNIQPQLEGYEYIVQRILKPEARKEVIEWLEQNDITPSSMIDISDGLSSELLHITKASQKGCIIYEEKLPIHENAKKFAMEINLPTATAALNGGEDYELLFTIKQEDYSKIQNAEFIAVIGYIQEEEKGCQFMSKAGNISELLAQGWNSLKN